MIADSWPCGRPVLADAISGRAVRFPSGPRQRYVSRMAASNPLVRTVFRTLGHAADRAPTGRVRQRSAPSLDKGRRIQSDVGRPGSGEHDHGRLRPGSVSSKCRPESWTYLAIRLPTSGCRSVPSTPRRTAPAVTMKISSRSSECGCVAAVPPRRSTSRSRARPIRGSAMPRDECDARQFEHRSNCCLDQVHVPLSAIDKCTCPLLTP